jgi:hypothetical protein
MKKSLFFTKTLSRKLFFTLTALMFLTIAANAQFEEKMSVNVAIGTVIPVGDTYYLDELDNNEPYIFSNFYAGASFLGGIQYNFNRRFSLEGRVYTFYLWDWSYFGLLDGWWDEISYEYWHLGIGIAPKFYLRPGKKVNPYGFAEVNVSYNDVYENYTDDYTYESDIVLEGDLTLGTYFGAGFDLNIISNLGIFAQAGYYINFTGGTLEYYGWEYENFAAVRGEAGVKLNLFKSKQL